MQPGKYQVAIYRTGYDANDAYSAYLRMGSPTSLSNDQLQQLQVTTADRPEMRTLIVDSNGIASLSIPMRSNDVVLVEVLAKR
jgi:xylan 1,4-beta-xylosidase